jgi:hypothetical protein
MTENSGHDSHLAASPGDSASEGNSGVRYERSDVEARGVVTFVVVLAGMMLVFGVLLAGLFRILDQRQSRANEKDFLPLAASVGDRLPSPPRLEGIDPTEDVGRAWPNTIPAEDSLPWFGYNVRVVPLDNPREAAMDAEERNRIAADAMSKKLQKVNQVIAELAGKLPMRKDAGKVPADDVRRSTGIGRPVTEKAP